MQTVQVIEDEPKVAESLYRGLLEAGYHVRVAHSGEEGLAQFLESAPDALVLDLNLPGRDGLEILKTIRQQQPQLPVLILSARDTIEDKVVGLDQGADDYLIKPFAFPELIARLRVMLRRDQQAATLEYHLSDLSIDLVTRSAVRAGRKLNLTPREFEILELLLRNQGRPVSRQMIATNVWGTQRATPLDNVIDVHVMRLRKKLDEDFAVKLIHTLRGMGYLIAENPDIG